MPVAKDVQVGRDVRIFHPDLVNLYGCVVGDETRIGTFVEIQVGAKIGARCKISSHTFICEGVTIEDEVFIGHGVMFTNDRFPRATADGWPTARAGGLEGGNHPSWTSSVDRVECNDLVRNLHWRGGDGRRWFRCNAGCSSMGGGGRRPSPSVGLQGQGRQDARSCEGSKIGATSRFKEGQAL